MTDTNRQDVLVVGAGPTGLVAATELARRGVRVQIVDKAATPTPIEQSRALGVQATTMEVFERLGVAQTVVAKGYSVNSVALYGLRGRRLGKLALSELPVPYPFVLTLAQGKIERVLEENLARHGVKVERSVELVTLRQGSDTVDATLRTADGGEKHVETQYLIGCDGAHSAVRELAGVQWPEGPYLDRYALADAKIEWQQDPLPDDQMHMFFSPKGVLVVGRLPDDRWRIVVSFPPRHPWHGEPTLSAVQQQVDVHPEIRARLYDPTWLSTYRNAFRMVDPLRSGRVFLAGDAAHVHSPVGAQGMNTGIQDAFNLGWKLALRTQGIGGESLLDSYHWERRPVISDLLRDTKIQERLMEAHHPVLARSRDDLLAFVTRHGALRRPLQVKFARSNTNYSRSPIVADGSQTLREMMQAVVAGAPYASLRERHAFRRGPNAGVRAPDAEGLVDAFRHGPTRLLEILAEDHRHSLIVFSGASARARRPGELGQLIERVEERYGALIRPLLVSTEPDERRRALLDLTGGAHRRYGAQFECLYLIRPDGYIAFRTQPADARPLEDFLEASLGVSGARPKDANAVTAESEPSAAQEHQDPTPPR